MKRLLSERKLCVTCGAEFGPTPNYRPTTWAKRRYCSHRCSVDGRPTPTPFFQRVSETETGCWEWQGYRSRDGYGRATDPDKYARTTNAHRLAWRLANGPIPGGLHVLHRCDNPPCVNPEHLFLGTNADNTHDRQSKGRGNPPKGERNANARFTTDEVFKIRARFSVAARPTYASVAREYRVGETAIRALVSRKTWRHVTEPVS